MFEGNDRKLVEGLSEQVPRLEVTNQRSTIELAPTACLLGKKCPAFRLNACTTTPRVFTFLAKRIVAVRNIGLKHLLRIIVLMWAKTIKRWLIFITVLSLIAMAGFFTQRFQVSRLAKSMVEQADNALHEGDFARLKSCTGSIWCCFRLMWMSRSNTLTRC